MYPSGYNVAAINAKNVWVAAHTDPLTLLVNCPGTGTPAHPAHQVNPGAITVEHNVAVADHWNNGWNAHPAGRNTTRANRVAFYNDSANHLYLCGPCNTALGSGGHNYRSTVTPNFRFF
jgi:hypothetical protein